MQDNKNNLPEEELEVTVFTLTDEETGEQLDFTLLAEAEIDGKVYYALEPASEEESEEYVILRVTEDGDDLVFETVDDDDEFEKVEDYFNDFLFNEIDYDKE